ncbi:MAG: ABC transporter substrate-binding protein [Candidatus Caldarchaeum sp.]
MSRRVIVAAVVVVVVLATLSAYMLTTPSRPKVEVVKIGAVYPLTGSLAPIGKDQINAIKLVFDEVNSKGGIKSLGGAKLELVPGDTKGDPRVGADETERLITVEKVALVIGAYQSAVTETASAVAERYKIPFVNPDSTSPALTERGFKWFFRTTPHDGLLVVGMLEFLRDLRDKQGIPLKTIAVVYENTLWGQDTGRIVKENAAKYGLEIALDLQYPSRTTDVSAEVQKIRTAKPDIVLFASYVTDAILYTKKLKELGVAPKVFIANDAGHIHSDYLNSVGKDSEYFFSREVFNWDLGEKKPAIKEANDKFKAAYGKDMDGTIARAYTAALLVVDVLERAGSIDPENIRKALVETNWSEEKTPMPWAGIKFDEKGQNILATGLVVQLQKGKYRTVWPWSVATVKPEGVPFPGWP